MTHRGILDERKRLSDTGPGHRALDRLGRHGSARVYLADDAGTTERALFVIDGEEVIQWNHVSPVGVNPGANGILTALDDMQGEGEEAA